MKTLNTYINEWKANTNTVSSIKKTQYFIYKINECKKIKIFESDWAQFNHYNDKAYINGKQIKLNNFGWTMEFFDPGEYYVEIKDIDNVTNCRYMFWNCTDLVKVQLFDTSKVEDMYGMFSHCKNLNEVPLFDTSKVKDMRWMFENCVNIKDVPLFDTSKLKYMDGMFKTCINLSEKTKKEWSQVYNFKTHIKI